MSRRVGSVRRGMCLLNEELQVVRKADEQTPGTLSRQRAGLVPHDISMQTGDTGANLGVFT